MKIYLGADHAGFELKEELKKFLSELGYETEDKGAFELNPQDDYPDFVFGAALAVSRDIEQGIDSRGVVIGGSGQGEAMAANKIKGIRAVLVYDEYGARMSREHNDANVAAFGARAIEPQEAKKLLKMWLETPFSGEERHVIRIDKIKAFEH